METVNKFKITAWLYIKDEMEPETVGQPFDTLEDAQIAAQAQYYVMTPRPYSMSIECGSDIWKWKPGRTWELQIDESKAVDVQIII